MNRNSFSRFALAPQVDLQRARFSRDTNIKTSFNVGELIPFYVDEVLPGDEFDVKTAKVLRLQTLITPTMENLYLDVYYFFVPNRLVWSHWEELMGANKSSAWIPQVSYSVPQLAAPSGGWNIGTIADYMGIPTGVSPLKVNALPFRAYALICDEWFRSTPNSQPLNIPVTDADVTGVNSGSYVTDVAKGGLPFVACRYFDYFSSCLPSPQRSPDVALPLGGYAPVTVSNHKADTDIWHDGDVMPDWIHAGYYGSDGKFHDQTTTRSYGVSAGGALKSYQHSATGVDEWPIFNNLYAKLGNVDNPATINEFRTAFQIQRLYERDARAGNARYIEILRSHFGVTSPDARLQRPEYLGGNRFPLNVQQVTQTSSTDAVTPQGNLAGFSVTSDVNHDFAKSFVEHGFIIGVCCARYEHSYQQGLERFWSRKQRFDYYWPALAHIGEQAVLKKELYCTGSNVVDNSVFGYQEAWADYRYKPNKITGQMRTAAGGGLDTWHYADNYTSEPYLSDAWIREDKTNVDRSLAVTSATANQIFGDIYISIKATRCMPLYSVPGLIDHF